MVNLLNEVIMSSKPIDSVNIIETLKSHKLRKHIRQSSIYQSLTSLEDMKLWNRLHTNEKSNETALLEVLETDQKIITNTCSRSRRRTVLLEKYNNHFGFTIQTYILQKRSKFFKISYIDYVHFDGPAANAGIRPGDIIVSINGRVVTEMSHNELVTLIKSCEEMRMILVFENIKERIQLTARAIRLRKLLSDKMYQLNQLDVQEQAILHRLSTCSTVGITERTMANNCQRVKTSDDSLKYFAANEHHRCEVGTEMAVVNFGKRQILTRTKNKGSSVSENSHEEIKKPFKDSYLEGLSEMARF